MTSHANGRTAAGAGVHCWESTRRRRLGVLVEVAVQKVVGQVGMTERRVGAGMGAPLLDASLSVNLPAGARPPLSTRAMLYDFLEPNRPRTAQERAEKDRARLKYRRSEPAEAGLVFEKCMVALILTNVFSFVLSTVCVIRTAKWHDAECTESTASGWPGHVFDAIEVVSVAVFTIEYVLRLLVIGHNDDYEGPLGLLKYLLSPFALVDLASILPYYLDLITPADDIPPVQFIRLLRVLRIMALGEYAKAFKDCGRAITQNQEVLLTSGFAGMAMWLIVASLYYLAERHNPEMIVEDFGFCINGSECDATEGAPNTCERGECVGENHFGNILNAMYFTLVNMFGEFPLIKEHSAWGRVVGCFTAVFAVAVFSVPVGVLGDGFGDAISEEMEAIAEMKEKNERLKEAFERADTDGSGGISKEELVDCMNSLDYEFTREEVMLMADRADTDKDGSISFDEFSAFVHAEFKDELRVVKPPPQDPAPGMTDSTASMIYRMLHPHPDTETYTDGPTSFGPCFEKFIMLLIVLNVLAFVLESVDEIKQAFPGFFTWFEAISAIVFTIEYALRLFCIGEEREYAGFVGRIKFIFTFYALVDVAAIAPFYIDLAMSADNLASTTFLRAFRLLRLFKANEYVRCMDRYVQIGSSCMPVFKLTFMLAMITWVFFAVLMYYAERHSRDDEMRDYYKDVPGAMWITLLNLSGESPLANYSTWGKIITGIIGIFATAFFCIPIGVLSGAFEKDFGLDDDDDSAIKTSTDREPSPPYCGLCGPAHHAASIGRIDYAWRKSLHDIVEAETALGRVFEALIFFWIVVTIVLSVLGTVDSIVAHEPVQNAFDAIEAIAVVIFTIEYLMRWVAAPTLKGYHHLSTPRAMLSYIFSFYAIVDMLAIAPWYLAHFIPAVDRIDEELRLFRILRLLKLDKYYPGITLIDDVLRANATNLGVAAFVAGVAWIIFASLLYLTEQDNHEEDAGYSMAKRFKNIPNSLSYTLILLSGDYPLTGFTWPGRAVNFVMVVIAQAVVAIPTAITVAGFMKQIEANTEGDEDEGADGDGEEDNGNAVVPGDDGTTLGQLHAFLSGKTSLAARAFEYGIATLIVLNILAVVLESIDEQRSGRVGSVPGDRMLSEHVYDGFELFSIIIFTVEYVLRLLAAHKASDAIDGYSSQLGYMFSFFGLVDIMTIAPFYIQEILRHAGVKFDAAPFRVFRVFRIFQLDRLCGSFSVMAQALRACKDTLIAFGLVALIIWIGAASLFYVFEKHNDLLQLREAFESIPSSM